MVRESIPDKKEALQGLAPFSRETSQTFAVDAQSGVGVTTVWLTYPCAFRLPPSSEPVAGLRLAAYVPERGAPVALPARLRKEVTP
ncbi:hypothetical protein D9M70_544550 [compost metagenome]